MDGDLPPSGPSETASELPEPVVLPRRTPPAGSSPDGPWLGREAMRLPHEPELDATISETSMPYEPMPEVYLRLVANPFLGAFGLLVWLVLMYAIYRGVAGPFSLMAAVLALASLALLPHLLHYHCLDCGRTGRLSAWRRHICPTVVARRFEGRERIFRGPSPTVQVLLWLWLLATLLLVWQAQNWRRN